MSSQTLKIQTPRVFRPLLEPARYRGAYGGRGSGKSHFFAELTVEEHLIYPGLRTIGVREVQRSIKESVKRLLEDKIESMGVGSYFNVLNDRIETPGDGVISFIGMQDHTAQSIKSYEGYHRALVEEAQTLSAYSLELLRPTIRTPGPTPISEIRFAWNPRNATDPVDKLLRGESRPENSIVVAANYMDNPWFPAELEEERSYDEIHNPIRYGHIWLGDYEPMAIGAIFNRMNIQQNRRPMDPDKLPDFERIVVAVDPAVSEDGDEHGIVVVAKGTDNRGYILADGSTPGSPAKWAKRALALHDEFDADAIICEVNQGGDLVEANIRAHRGRGEGGVRVIKVRASRGKHVRAEPISALYEQDRISHVGSFPELESQLCLITHHGYDGEDSPDRADALIWGLTELFPKLTRKAGNKKRPLQANRKGYNPRKGMRING